MNEKAKLSFLLGFLLTLSLTFIFADTSLAAEIQIYPKGYGNTSAPGGTNDTRDRCFGHPVAEAGPDGVVYISSTAECGGEGDFFEDTTEPHGAVNHRAGQTFYVPQNMTLSRIRLYYFFIGAEGQTNGGRASVYLRQGGHDGPIIAGYANAVYVTGHQYNNWLSPENVTYCRWHINNPNNPYDGYKIDNQNTPCRLETSDYAVSWAVMPFVTPLEVNFSKISPVLTPGKYYVEIVQDLSNPSSNDNIAVGLFNRFNAIGQISAYYQDNQYDDYDAKWDWYWPGANSGRDLSSLAIWGNTLPDRDSTFVGQQCPPSTMTSGQSAPVWVKMKNTGANTWTAANNYRLGSQNPQDNNNWGLYRVFMPYNTASGQEVTFSFNVTAPTVSTPGDYNFQWKMLQESVAWFEAPSTNCTVRVNPPSSAPTPTPIPPPPSISSLKIVTNPTSFSGIYKISGLRESEGGAGWYNPLVVTLGGNANGSGNYIKYYYAAFYDKNLGASSSFNDVRARIANNPSRGLMLASGGSLLSEDKNSSGYYYVWNPRKNACAGDWENISGAKSEGIDIFSCSGIRYYNVKPGSSAGMWEVTFFQNFGNKNMFTAAQVIDSYNQPTFSTEVSPSR